MPQALMKMKNCLKCLTSFIKTLSVTIILKSSFIFNWSVFTVECDDFSYFQYAVSWIGHVIHNQLLTFIKSSYKTCYLIIFDKKTLIFILSKTNHDAHLNLKIDSRDFVDMKNMIYV